MRLLPVTAAAVSAFVIAGCTGTEGAETTPAPSVPVTGARAEVDEASGLIQLPIDRFRISESEHDDVVSALLVAQIQCVERSGLVSADKPTRVIPDNPSSLRYGLWRADYASRYGYVVPESPEKLEALKRNQDPSGSTMTQQELDVRARCAQEDPTVKGFREDTVATPWDAEVNSASAAAAETPQWKKVIAEWTSCIEGKGLQPDPEQLATPLGVDSDAVERGRVQESDVKIAVIDVACKNQVKLVQRLGDLEASAQQPVIDHYRAELDAYRAKVVAQHAAAVKLLTDAGV